MAKTYEPIATTTLGSAAADITFSGISGSYTDLVLVYAGTGTSTNTHAVRFRFNSDTGTNYSYTYLRGDGTSASSVRTTNNTFMLAISNTTNSGMNNAIIQIQNYSNTTTYKTALVRGNDPSARLEATVNLWRSTSAITSVTLIPETGTLNAGTTVTLYGIKAA
jgi:hypothetical protein